MKFLVIVACLLISHYWQRERSLPGDRWYPAYRNWLGRQLGHLPGLKRWHSEESSLLLSIALIVLPALLVLGVLWLVEGVLLGFITLGIHLLLLLLLFERCNLGELTREYLERWRRCEYESAFELLQCHMPERMQGKFEDYATVHQRYCDLLLASHFEKLFVLLFWYLLLGPVGALSYSLARLYLQADGVYGSRVWREGADPVALMSRLLFILEYLPARLLVLAFALAGNFTAAFGLLRRHLFDAMAGFHLVKLGAIAAIGNGGVRDELEMDAEAEFKECFAGNPECGIAEAAARQLEDLQALMIRSQTIWVSALALMILYGVGSRI